MATTILFILWGKLKDNNKGVLKDITKSLSHKYELLICLSLYTNRRWILSFDLSYGRN